MLTYFRHSVVRDDMANGMQGKLLAEQSNWKLIRFDEVRDDLIKRPPYQRRNVQSIGKKSEDMDSFVRQLYVPSFLLILVKLLV